jgi:short subunit dehydrogenase-like uncharacterized protein
VRGRLAALDPMAAELPLLTADVADAATLGALAASSRVVVSTVGPYLLRGEGLVAACAQAGTDYVDLCGEPEFVDLMYLRYHELARETGARLVHSCGFDSIPYDLGALFTVSQIPDAASLPIALEGFGLVSGSISGGTFHSAVNAIGRLKESGRASRQRRSVERHAPDGKLAEGRRVRGFSRRPHRDALAGGWVVSAPTIDPQNVLRSARLNEQYGPDFSYAHYIVTRRLTRTAGLGLGIGAIATLAQVKPTRKLVLAFKRQGTGPSEAKRAKSFFRVRFRAQVGGEQPQRLVTEVSGGDPGYGETAKMLAQSALCLAFDEVPAPGGGQWTPAFALGQPLIDRLVGAGISFRVIDPA